MRGNICVSPKLAEHLKGELTKELAVAKERRRAREERALASETNNDKKKGNRKGKYDDDG